MDLSGTTALVTGANRGLGDAFARALATECDLVLAGMRDPSAYSPPVKNISPVRMDLTSRETIDECLAEAGDKLQSVDVLVNNAGSLSIGLLEQQDPDAIADCLQVNLGGLIHLTRMLLPGMLRRERGLIVNNASFSGYVYFPLASVYAASKAGVVAFSESLRRELEPTGVSVMHLVTPGVETEMLAATEAGYGEHFDTSGWDTVKPGEWAEKMLDGIHRDHAVVQPGGKTRVAILASRGPGALLDNVAGRIFKR